MGKPEGIIEDYLIKKSKEHDAICWKFTSPGQRGVPDRIVIHNGQVYFIELKSKTGQLSDIQKSKIKKMKQHGANVYVFNSKSVIDQFFEMIKASSDTTDKIKQPQMQPWICTDNDCMQHLRIIQPYIYQCIQIECIDTKHYNVTSACIDLDDYTIEDLNDILKCYYSTPDKTPLSTALGNVWTSYTNPSTKFTQAVNSCNQIIAECIFESTDDKSVLKTELSWKQAVDLVTRIIAE